MNTKVIALGAAVCCTGLAPHPVKADAKPVSPSYKPWVAAESDVLGDWQTNGEGWRIRLNADHSAAIYFEGCYESPPSFSTWKLTGNHVILADASLFKDSDAAGLGEDFIVIPSQSCLVMLPKKQLPIAEQRGFVTMLCLWHSVQKAKTQKLYGNDSEVPPAPNNGGARGE